MLPYTLKFIFCQRIRRYCGWPNCLGILEDPLNNISFLNLIRRKYQFRSSWRLKQHPKITELSISKFVDDILYVVSVSKGSELVITTTHFMHYPSTSNYKWTKKLTFICDNIPLIIEGGNSIREGGSLNFLFPASTPN